MSPDVPITRFMFNVDAMTLGCHVVSWRLTGISQRPLCDFVVNNHCCAPCARWRLIILAQSEPSETARASSIAFGSFLRQRVRRASGIAVCLPAYARKHRATALLSRRRSSFACIGWYKTMARFSWVYHPDFKRLKSTFSFPKDLNNVSVTSVHLFMHTQTQSSSFF